MLFSFSTSGGVARRQIKTTPAAITKTAEIDIKMILPFLITTIVYGGLSSDELNLYFVIWRLVYHIVVASGAGSAGAGSLGCSNGACSTGDCSSTMIVLVEVAVFPAWSIAA